MAKVDLGQLQQMLMMQRMPMGPQPTIIKIDLGGILSTLQQLQRAQLPSMNPADRAPVRESISPRPG